MEEYDSLIFPERTVPATCHYHGYALRHFDCEGKTGYGRYPNCALVKLYAKMGLHRFYLMKESELQYNDWIYLYVEVLQPAMHLFKFKLEIVQVAIETLDDVEPPKLKSKTAVVYIAFKGLVKARDGEPCDHKAIVRRVFNEATGILSLRGKYWTGDKKALASKMRKIKR